MRRIFAVTFLTLCLSACAHQEAGPAGAGMAWSLNEVEGEGLKLAYGAPQSDNVLMMLTCEPRSNAVRVSVNAAGAGALRLTSGSHSWQRSAQSGPSGFGDGTVLEAELPASDPVLANFARSGELAVSAASQRSVLPTARSEASRFVSACRA